MRNARFTVQERTDTKDSVGGASVTWTDKFHMTGELKALKGYEQLRGMSMEAKVTHRFSTWYDSRLREEHRLLMNGVAYNITFIDNVDNQNREMIVSLEQTKYGG